MEETPAVAAPVGNASRMLSALFILAIFSAAALLFLVEPLVARLILPVLGGSPVVWVTALAFFQVTLLLGYTYAHVTSQMRRRNRALTHGAVLVASLFVIPVTLPAWEAPSSDPYLWLVGLMAVSVGMPFFVLASASPSLASWYTVGSNRDPYFLFAVSNAGSFVGLLSYPLIVEPTLGLSSQTGLWAWGFAAFAAVAAFAVVIALRTSAAPIDNPQPARTGPPISWRQRLVWIGLAFVPSSLLLGSTTFITSEIGSVPLLWVAPLAAYLLTFVIAFSDRKRPSPNWPSRLLPFLVFGAVTAWAIGSSPGLWIDVTLHVGLLFTAGLVAHLRLYNTRPDSEHLTEFYLLISLGGALGGIFNAFVAPLIFDWALEYPLVIVVATALMVDRSSSKLNRIRTWWPAIAAAAVALAADLATSGFTTHSRAAWAVIAVGVAALFLLSAQRAIVFALGIGLLIMVFPPIDGDATHRERTFFGILSVREEDGQRSMFHGSTLHGTQFLDARAEEPAAYYSFAGPLGDVFTVLEEQRTIGLVGLGVGAIAAYGQPGDTMTYYEIDQAVVDLAQDEELFTFLAGSQADIDVIVEDGRLGLERTGSGTFDLIVLDAFTADAIPVHLLTVEALEVYLDRAAQDGLVAIHVSNRFFDLEPVMAAAAAHLDATVIIRSDRGDDTRAASRWAVMAANADTIAPLLNLPGWHHAEPRPGFRLWTDDYSNPLAVLR